MVRRAALATTSLAGIGVDRAGQLLVSAGQNVGRLHSEAAFGRLCCSAPVPASSGRAQRHRLGRGGDRQANRALQMAVVVRLRRCPRTRAYVERRTAEGLSKPEVMRCLKRYLAREAVIVVKLSRSRSISSTVRSVVSVAVWRASFPICRKPVLRSTIVTTECLACP
jgi:transposase